MSKVLITGTGRCGSTFLMHLCTALTMSTGFTLRECKQVQRKRSRGGLERTLDSPQYILKNPEFCTQIAAAVDQWKLDLVYVPTRDLTLASASREYMSKFGVSGGLIHVERPEDQLSALAQMRGQLMHDLSQFQIPFVELEFPRFIDDAEYCFESLEFLVTKFDIAKAKFLSIHRQIANPSLVRFRKK